MRNTVYVNDINRKASLNAPLLDWLFKINPNVDSIVHYHEIELGYPVREYAPPGTVRDSLRHEKTSFNVSGHGVFLLIDKDGNII